VAVNQHIFTALQGVIYGFAGAFEVRCQILRMGVEDINPMAGEPVFV
jgi:hypothetical protein